MIAEGKESDYGWIMETEEKRKKAEQLGVTEDKSCHTSLTCGASGKESAFQCRRHKRHDFDPWVRRIPWRRA